MSSEEDKCHHCDNILEELFLAQRRLPVGYNAPLRSSCVSQGKKKKPTGMNKAVLVGE